MGEISDATALSLVTFNVNGLRGALRRASIKPRSLTGLLESFGENVAIVCLQEIKLTTKDLDYELCRPAGWEAYYSLAQATTTGATATAATRYSGVGTYTRSTVARPWDAREQTLWVVDRLLSRFQHNSNNYCDKLLEEAEAVYRIISINNASNGVKQSEVDASSRSSVGLADTFGMSQTELRPRATLLSLPSWEAAENAQAAEKKKGGNIYLELVLQKLEELRKAAIKLDTEGRIIITHHGGFVVINVYCPAVRLDIAENIDESRLQLKKDFHSLMHLCAREIMCFATERNLPSMNYSSSWATQHSAATKPKYVVICGDFNVRLTIEDSSDPVGWTKSSLRFPFIGQTQALQKDLRLVDAFRKLHPDAKNDYTCWNQVIGARVTNLGARIDLILIPEDFFSPQLVETSLECIHLHDFMGSDHCPVVLTCSFISRFLTSRNDSAKPPTLSAIYLPQGARRQATLSGGSFTLIKSRPNDGVMETCRSDSVEWSFTNAARVDSGLLLAQGELDETSGGSFSASFESVEKAELYVAPDLFFGDTSRLKEISALRNIVPDLLIIHLCIEEKLLAGEYLPNAKCLRAKATPVSPFPTEALQKIRADPFGFLWNASFVLKETAFQSEKDNQQSCIHRTTRFIRRCVEIGWRSFYVISLSQADSSELIVDALSRAKFAIAKVKFVGTMGGAINITDRGLIPPEPLPDGNIPQEVASQEKPAPSEKISGRDGTRFDKKSLEARIAYLSGAERSAYFSLAHIAPLCAKHRIPCIKRRVRKAGPNEGRELWQCPLPQGGPGTRQDLARCHTFLWANEVQATSEQNLRTFFTSKQEQQ